MSETAEDAPTCYRHPDRETYVRCTRCDRPICPDCMHAASVGFQCPECVREGNKSIRQARTVFGGRVGADANVTKVLIGLNVILFVGQLASAAFTDRFQMESLEVAFRGDFHRMLTSAFLHDPRMLLHILFNMYALLAVGSQIERLLGATRYLVLYVVAAFGGSVATLWFINPLTASLGASGAVFGLFGAFFVLLRKLRADTSQVLFLIGINLVFGFALGGYINNWAHIGGLVTGGAVAFAFAHAPAGRNRTLLQYTGAVLVTVLLLVATAARVADWRAQGEDVVELKARIDRATSAAGAPSR